MSVKDGLHWLWDSPLEKFPEVQKPRVLAVDDRARVVLGTLTPILFGASFLAFQVTGPRDIWMAVTAVILFATATVLTVWLELAMVKWVRHTHQNYAAKKWRVNVINLTLITVGAALLATFAVVNMGRL